MKKPDLTNLSVLYDKKIECSACKTLFTSKKVRSRFVKPQAVDSDFGPIYAPGDEGNPLLYFVAVCPECGFSFTEDFSKPLSSSVRQIIVNELSNKLDRSVDFCGPRDFSTAVRTYKLAIYSGELVREKHITFAKLCLRLAWLQRNKGDREEEKRFLQLAATEFEQSYIHSDFNPEKVPEIFILYMIGELNRRLGNYDIALRYYDAVVNHRDRSRYTRYIKMAREQWKIAVDEHRARK
ncbi:MAG: DUF2225 domain-containing protein [Desulfitobacteriia bacterium]|jgi:uncharacterized protein (DUF2225 family)